jgi:hypothetical protein
MARPSVGVCNTDIGCGAKTLRCASVRLDTPTGGGYSKHFNTGSAPYNVSQATNRK